MTEDLLIVTTVIAIFLSFSRLRMQFKIRIYEKGLKSMGININDVKNMAWWKLWIN